MFNWDWYYGVKHSFLWCNFTSYGLVTLFLLGAMIYQNRMACSKVGKAKLVIGCMFWPLIFIWALGYCAKDKLEERPFFNHIRKLWRVYYDYPVNWQPWGYEHADMTREYWMGMCMSSRAIGKRVDDDLEYKRRLAGS